MAAEYSAATPQNVLTNQPVVFTDAPCPCNQGLVFKKSGGVFLLASNAPSGNSCGCGCGCRRIYETDYEIDFHANIEIPEGGTVEEIQLAFSIDGVVDPASVMSFTPSAVEVAGNIGSSIIASIPSICGCDSIAVVNVSNQPITVNNAVIVFDYAGVRRLR